MKIATAHYHSNIPEGAIIYGGFTQPFGPGVTEYQACERLAVIIENNAPDGWLSADNLAYELTQGLDWPNDGCTITFYIYSTEG